MRCPPPILLCALAVLLLVAPAGADEVDEAIAAAWSAFQGGDAKGAQTALEALRSANPEDVRPNARLAYILLMTDGDLEQVFDLLVLHLEARRGDQWALQHLSICAERALAVGRPELARSCAKVLMEAQPGEKEHRYLWAQASYRLGRRDSVAEACRSLIDDYPSWELPYWLLSRALSDQGEFDEVEQVYRQLLEEQPGNVDARLRMARAQLSRRNYDAAEDTYRSALEIAESGSELRDLAEAGMAFVRSERKLTSRLRKQNEFLDRMLMVVGAAWALLIIVMVLLTRAGRR